MWLFPCLDKWRGRDSVAVSVPVKSASRLFLCLNKWLEGTALLFLCLNKWMGRDSVAVSVLE